MAEQPSALPEPPEDTGRTRARLVAEKIARQAAVDDAARLQASKTNYPASPLPSGYTQSQTDNTPIARLSAPPIGAFEVDQGGGALFAKPSAPKKPSAKQQPQPVKPTPVTVPSIFSSNPALASAIQEHNQTTQTTDWRDRAADQGQAAIDHFQNEPQVTGYHWYAPTGGLQGGNNATMIQHMSDGSRREVPANNIPGATPENLPTTLDAQNALLTSGGGGVLPPWNSPTGRAIDTQTGKEVSFSNPTPPQGWLQSALKAAKSGAATYNTGAPARTTPEGNYPVGGIQTQGEKAYIATPSGGTMGVNPGVLYEGADRATQLAKKISQSQWTSSGTAGEVFKPDNRTGEVLY